MKRFFTFVIAALCMSSCIQIATRKPLADMGQEGQWVRIPGADVAGKATVYKAADGKLYVLGLLSPFVRCERPLVQPLQEIKELGPFENYCSVTGKPRKVVFGEVQSQEIFWLDGQVKRYLVRTDSPWLAMAPPGAKPVAHADVVVTRPGHTLKLREQKKEFSAEVVQPLQPTVAALYAYPLAAVGTVVDVPATVVVNVMAGVGMILTSPAIISEVRQQQQAPTDTQF